MSKSRNHSTELEQLRQELRNLKSENRHLKKQLSRASKNLNRLEDLEELVRDEGLKDKEPVIVDTASCPRCRGKLKSTPIADIRILYKCSDCDYRKTEKRK